ncbi:MAG: extracellular solute-binding protein [Planctomycetota bacterium JB042]
MPRSRALEALLLVLPVLALPGLLFGLSRGEQTFRYPSEPARTLRLVIASPQHQGIKNEFEEGFKRWLFERDGTGVEVTWLDHGGGTKTLRWIEEQYRHSPDGIGVDVLFGGGTDPYEELKADGRMERYDPPHEVLDGVALDLGGFPIVDPDHTWFGTALTGFGLMVNRAVLERVPKLEGIEVETWEDLCDPRLDGWVGAADPRNSSSYHTFYEILLQSAPSFDEGLALARRIGANVSAYAKYSIQVPQLCAVGQVACAPSIDQYVAAQIEKVGDAIVFTLPEGKTLVNADAAGILKGAPNGEAARAFIDFLLSEAAGRLWMGRVGDEGGPRRQPLVRASVRPHLYRDMEGRTDVRDDPFLLEQTFRYDYDKASLRWTLLNDLLGALVIDTQDDLREAMRALRRLEGPAREEAEERLFANPLTEAEMLELARTRWDEDEFKERKRIEWADFARANYRAVAAMAASAADDGGDR